MISSIAALGQHGQLVIAACVLYAILGVASIGVTIGTRAKPASQLRLQVNSWWLIFPVVSVCLAFYPVGPLVLVALIGMLALRELARLACAPGRLLFIGGALLGATLLLSARRPDLLGFWTLLLAPIMTGLRRGAATDALLGATFAFTLAGLVCLLQLMHLPLAAGTTLRWMFYLFVLTALNDVGQFIAGKLLGRQKIAPSISPNKTWQGLGGGVAASVAVSTTLGGYLGLAALPQLLTLGVLLALGGFAGDLAYSSIKRRLGIKDFSQLIPGHGGILDRADSLVVTAPLLYLFILTQGTHP